MFPPLSKSEKISIYNVLRWLTYYLYYTCFADVCRAKKRTLIRFLALGDDYVNKKTHSAPC